MLRRVRTSPDRWVVPLVLATVALTLAVVVSLTGSPARVGLSHGLTGLGSLITAWSVRRQVRHPEEPARAAWDRMDEAEARLEERRRG